MFVASEYIRNFMLLDTNLDVWFIIRGETFHRLSSVQLWDTEMNAVVAWASD